MGQEGTAHTPSPSPLQPPHLRKATQDDSIGRDPIFHLMFNQSFDWGVGRARLGGGGCWGLKGSKQALPSASGREGGRGCEVGAGALLFSAAFLIPTSSSGASGLSPIRSNLGKQRQQFLEELASPSSNLSCHLFPAPHSPGRHHHLHVECHRDPGPAEGWPGGLRRDKASVESLGMGTTALGGPSQQAEPMFQVLPGNLPRGAGACGWGISDKDGEAETNARGWGPAQRVSTWKILCLGGLGSRKPWG